MQWNNKTVVIILRPCINKIFKLECISQINKDIKSHAIKRLSLMLKWKSELLLAKVLKSLRETTWSQRSIWHLIAVVVLVFNFFLVKGETPCSFAIA